ncbi:MAG: PrsW family intramembrane metalloprotease [Candidatus Aminicenantes bacterium]|nr:PrsW family intramembrane metalloprotease [Candidatus Aminicenantes bacterium]
MPKIFIAAIIATFFSLFFYASYVFRIGDKKDYIRLLTVFLITLPLCPLAYYLVRLPLDSLIRNALSQDSFNYRFIITWYAPLTEEIVKLIPFFLPFLFRRISSKNFVSFGMAAGLGFGIGQIWLSAFRTSRLSQNFLLPFGYVLLGFVAERLMVCFLHGTFTSFVLWRWKRKWVWGLAGAVILHYLANLPIHLSTWNIGLLSPSVWRYVLPIYLVVFFMAMVLLLVFFRAGTEGLLNIFSKAKITCPTCQKQYERSYWMTHLSNKGHEKCPLCGSQNTIDIKKRP